MRAVQAAVERTDRRLGGHENSSGRCGEDRKFLPFPAH
jgi:hypothetical protein